MLRVGDRVVALLIVYPCQGHPDRPTRECKVPSPKEELKLLAACASKRTVCSRHESADHQVTTRRGFELSTSSPRYS